MMHFNTFTRKGTEASFPQFLLCNAQHNDQPCALDIVCIDENCKEKSKLICVHCRYDSHRRHKVQPLPVFLQKYEQMLLRSDKTPESLDLSYLEFLFQRTRARLDRILADFQENFNKVIKKLNEEYQGRLRALERTIADEDQNMKLNYFKMERDSRSANEILNNLLNNVAINKEEEFRSRTHSRAADEFRGLENNIYSLEKFIDRDLEKSLGDFKKALNATANRLNQINNIIEEREEEKLKEKPQEDEKGRKFIDIKQKENELLFRNYKFSQFLEILKHDFTNMMDKLEDPQSLGIDFKRSEKFVKNKREFIAEFETSLLKFPQKDLVGWKL